PRGPQRPPQQATPHPTLHPPSRRTPRAKTLLTRALRRPKHHTPLRPGTRSRPPSTLAGSCSGPRPASRRSSPTPTTPPTRRTAPSGPSRSAGTGPSQSPCPSSSTPPPPPTRGSGADWGRPRSVSSGSPPSTPHPRTPPRCGHGSSSATGSCPRSSSPPSSPKSKEPSMDAINFVTDNIGLALIVFASAFFLVHGIWHPWTDNGPFASATVRHHPKLQCVALAIIGFGAVGTGGLIGGWIATARSWILDAATSSAEWAFGGIAAFAVIVAGVLIWID